MTPDNNRAVSQSPTEPDFVQNPYRFYDAARRKGEVLWWEEYGMPVAFGHGAVDTILRSRKLGRAPAGGHPPRPDHLADFYAIDDFSMLELDGAPHTRLRKLVVGAFSAARVASLSPGVSLLTDELIAGFPDGPFDFIEAFATHLPVSVIARLIGVPDAMGPELLHWSNAMVAMYQARRDRALEDAANAAARDFRAYLLDLIEEKRKRPGDDLMSALIIAEAEGDRLSREELVATCVLLLNAGHEATVHTLGNGLYTLLRLDQPFEVVTPQAIAATVEEILRFDPPLHMFTREAHDHVTIGGWDLKPGDRIGACLASANRDASVFENADGFDPSRPNRQQLSFGAGPHFCIGAPLARLELQIALPALHSRALNLRLVEKPRYANLYHFHGLERLMVERG